MAVRLITSIWRPATMAPVLTLLSVATLATAMPAAGQQGRQVQSANYRVVRDRARADTLNAGVVNANAVVYMGDPSASTNFGPGGVYRLLWQDDAYGIRGGVFYRYKQASQLQPELDAALGSRAVASTAVVDEALRGLPNFPGGAMGTRPMIAAKLPFQIIGVNGQPADAVMFQRHVSGDRADSLLQNSRLWGNVADTVRLQIPPDAWLPGDTLFVIARSGSVSTVALKLTLGCSPSRALPARITCNPIALGTTGATGYLPLAAGYESVWRVTAAAGGSPRER